MILELECSEDEMCCLRDTLIDQYHEQRKSKSQRGQNRASFLRIVGDKLADMLRTQQHKIKIKT